MPTRNVKVQVYSLKTHHPTSHFTPWSLDVFIRVPFQLHGEHTVLQPFRRNELIVHIAFSVLPGNHFTWIKWRIWRWSALPKDTTSKQCSNIERGETENPAPSGIRNRTAGSDIRKAPLRHVPHEGISRPNLKYLTAIQCLYQHVSLNYYIWTAVGRIPNRLD